MTTVALTGQKGGSGPKWWESVKKCRRGHPWGPGLKRCNECRRMTDQIRSQTPKYKAYKRESSRKRYHSDPIYRATMRKRAAAFSRKLYDSDEKYRRAQAKRQLHQRRTPETWVSSRMVFMRNRSKVRGWPFALTPADVLVATHCPVFGTKLEFGGRRNNPDSPSIDRIDNRLGYVAGNVWVISLRANHLKNDSTLEELEQLTKVLRKRLRLSRKGAK